MFPEFGTPHPKTPILPESFDPAGKLLPFTGHESRVTVLVPRTLASKRPQCQNEPERIGNATPGNISALSGV
jgi:hypothetical protein